MNFVQIELDKVRNLRYGLMAMSIIEEKFDKAMSLIDFSKLKIKELATIVYAGLIHEDKELTVEKVLELLDQYSDIKKINEAMLKAISAGFGLEEKK